MTVPDNKWRSAPQRLVHSRHQPGPGRYGVVVSRLDSVLGPSLCWKRGLVIAAGFAIAAIGLYGASRPCVLGPCPPLKRQSPAVPVAALLTPTATPQDVTQAYELLLQHIVELNRIPLWSSRYKIAQTRLEGYKAQADSIARLLEAQELGYGAAVASQDAPHPLETWQAIAQQWQQAIAALGKIPEAAPEFAVAQQKLREYQQNYAAIAQRITLEQQAQLKIAEARRAATLAETRAANAQSPEAWQQVYITWQVAFERLEAISPHTLAHAEAQQLNALYHPQAQSAKLRQEREQTSAKAYQQAQQQAQAAQALEQQGQWSLATAQWRQALKQLTSVPEGTAFYEQAQPLKQTYTKFLERSQQGITIATAVQQSRQAFDQACQQTQLCRYEVTSSTIKLHVSPSYQQAIATALRQTYPTPPEAALASVAKGSGAEDRPTQLLSTIATLGNRIQVPIEFYNSAGGLMGTYRPDQGRFAFEPASPTATAG